MIFSHLKSLLIMLLIRSGSLIRVTVHKYRLTAKHKLGVDARFMYCPTPGSIAQHQTASLNQVSRSTLKQNQSELCFCQIVHFVFQILEVYFVSQF